MKDEDDDEHDENKEEIDPKKIFRDDDSLEDFVDEDDDGPLGAPAELPIQFSHFGTMKGKELFKFAVEWMVQKQINPGFDANDELYKITFQKLDTEVRVLAGSKFMSSVWTPGFSAAVHGRPAIEYNEVSRADRLDPLHDKCQACNRSGHPATWEVRFTGKLYHPETLEPLGRDSDSEANSNSESTDSIGNPTRAGGKSFKVGR